MVHRGGHKHLLRKALAAFPLHFWGLWHWGDPSKDSAKFLQPHGPVWWEQEKVLTLSWADLGSVVEFVVFRRPGFFLNLTCVVPSIPGPVSRTLFQDSSASAPESPVNAVGHKGWGEHIHPAGGFAFGVLQLPIIPSECLG